MRDSDRIAYIVACIRDGGSMYPDDAAAFLAEHDAHRRAEVLAEAADELENLLAEHEGSDASCHDFGRAIAQLCGRWRTEGGKDTSGGTQPAAGESTQTAVGTCGREDWVICCSPDPRCPNGERRDRAVERGWTQNGRAGNWLCATHSPSDFFRPDRTYTRPAHGRTVEFRVTHISTPPGGGEPMAFGWHRVSGYDAWRDHSDDDFAVWTEVVEAGESRG